MFLVVIARPRFDSNGQEVYSEKIEIFSIVMKEPTKRSSVNRSAETLKTKLITFVEKDIAWEICFSYQSTTGYIGKMACHLCEYFDMYIAG